MIMVVIMIVPATILFARLVMVFFVTMIMAAIVVVIMFTVIMVAGVTVRMFVMAGSCSAVAGHEIEQCQNNHSDPGQKGENPKTRIQICLDPSRSIEPDKDSTPYQQSDYSEYFENFFHNKISKDKLTKA